MTDQLFGRKLKEIRLKKGLTQKELADLLFVSRRCIGNWEAGRRKPDIITIPMIADALKVDTNYFFNRDSYSIPVPNVIIFNNEKTIISEDTQLIKKVLSCTNLKVFDSLKEALSYAHSTSVSIVFLDLDDNYADSFFLAKELTTISNKTNLIFISEDPQYALNALDLFCSGYILKPLSQKKISEQLEHLRFPVNKLIRNIHQ